MDTKGIAAKVQVSENGPYLVSGGLPLSKETIGVDAAGASVRWEQGQSFPSQPRYALCRCGASHNKPFCDGSHASIGFRDDIGR